jgi:NADH-quinone oxidoreductase subunit K
LSMIPIDHVIALSAILFGIGVLGVLTRRNLVVMLMSIELMLNAAILAFVVMNRIWPGAAGASDLDGQVFALIVMTIAVAEVVVGVGIVLSLRRHRESNDPDEASLLKW